ncbi:MAG: DUF1501 domain-containing protein, partial [Planctomycetota bacterium]
YRMQAAVPDAMDIGDEPESIRELYGAEPGGESFANNCLLARRLAERGVRYIQLYDWGWDSHGSSEKEALNGGFQGKCRDIDRPIAALLTDLKQRGMLDDTLVVWGGEFGRTVYCQGTLTQKNYGRDHHPKCFTVWLAGAGVQGGVVHGETDDFSYNVTRDPVHIRDLNATILHQLGIDHERFVYPFKGLDQRLTGVEPASVVRPILSGA